MQFILVASSNPAQKRARSNLLFAFSLVRCLANLLTSLFSHIIQAHAIEPMVAAGAFDKEQETGMRSIGKFAYAAVLSLGMFSVQPTPVAAEEPHGIFTLSHEVHWQNCVLRPGDYAFALKTSGAPTILSLRGLNGTGSDAMLLVTDVESIRENAASKLELVSRDGESFVSTMDLPGYGMTLRFTIPSPSSAK